MSNPIPSQDSVHSSFDTAERVASKVLILLSSPRSGSTMISERIKNWGVCVTHEYFQPFQYLPALADRWNCLENGAINHQRYVEALFSNRSSSSGWLGINLHGSHIAHFNEYFKYFPKLEAVKIIHLRRRDSLRQAISYEIASQTGQWSSHFERAIDPIYDYKKIKNKLERIEKQTRTNLAFIEQNSYPSLDIFYEDFKNSPDEIRKFLGFKCDAEEEGNQISKQSSKINDQWLTMLSEDILCEEG